MPCLGGFGEKEIHQYENMSIRKYMNTTARENETFGERLNIENDEWRAREYDISILQRG